MNTFEVDHRDSIIAIRAHDKLVADLNSKPNFNKLANNFVLTIGSVFCIIIMIAILLSMLTAKPISIITPVIHEVCVAPKQGGISDDTIDISPKHYATVIHEDYKYTGNQ